MARLTDGDVLMVLSDHGFNSFRRGVNLNSWLHANGYLTLKPGADGSAEWLRDVDWSQTRAYALGLTGLFLNVKGREAQGIVEPGEGAAQLRKELVAKLSGLSRRGYWRHRHHRSLRDRRPCTRGRIWKTRQIC